MKYSYDKVILYLWFQYAGKSRFTLTYFEHLRISTSSPSLQHAQLTEQVSSQPTPLCSLNSSVTSYTEQLLGCATYLFLINLICLPSVLLKYLSCRYEVLWDHKLHWKYGGEVGFGLMVDSQDESLLVHIWHYSLKLQMYTPFQTTPSTITFYMFTRPLVEQNNCTK